MRNLVAILIHFGDILRFNYLKFCLTRLNCEALLFSFGSDVLFLYQKKLLARCSGPLPNESEVFHTKKKICAHREKPEAEQRRVFSHRWALFWLLNVLNSPPQHRDHYNFIHTRAIAAVWIFGGRARRRWKSWERRGAFSYFSPYFLIVCSTEKWEVDARNNNKVGSRRRDGFLCAISTLYAENCVAWMESGSPAAAAVAYLIVVETGVDLFGSFFFSLDSRYGSGEGGEKIDDEKLVEELRGLTQKQNWDLSNLWLLLKAARGQRCRLTAVSLGFCVWIWIMMEKMRIFLCVRLFCTSLRILSRFLFVVISNVSILNWNTRKFAISKSHRLSSRQYNLKA